MFRACTHPESALIREGRANGLVLGRGRMVGPMAGFSNLSRSRLLVGLIEGSGSFLFKRFFCAWCCQSVAPDSEGH